MLDAAGRTLPLHGAQRLLLAVLGEAIGTFRRCRTARDRRGRATFEEAEAWFASEETEWMFSFVSVCDALGIDPTYVRSGLRRWMRGQHAPFEAALLQDLVSFRSFPKSGRHVGRGAMTGQRAGRLPRPRAGPERERNWPVPSRPSHGSGRED
jgi:hypothetical protein